MESFQRNQLQRVLELDKILNIYSGMSQKDKYNMGELNIYCDQNKNYGKNG